MPEGNANGGNGNTGNGNGGSPVVPVDMRQMLHEFLEEHKVPEKERKTYRDNLKLRFKLGELRAENERLKSAGPTDGGIVLSKEDAAEYQAFKKLNLKSADLANVVKEHGELKAKVAERDAEELYVDAADALGFENLALFMRTMTREGLHLEFKEERQKNEETGKTEVVQVPMVRPKADEKAQLEPLADYLERELGAEFIEAFQTAPTDDAEELDESGEAGDETMTRRIARLSQGERGERGQRRTAGTAAGTGAPATGVQIPVTRNARPSSGASRDEKARQAALEEKASSGLYGI